MDAARVTCPGGFPAAPKTAPAPGPSAPLWIEPGWRETARATTASAPPWQEAFLRPAETDDAECPGLVAEAWHAWLEQDAALASQPLENFLGSRGLQPGQSDLGKAEAALSLALLFDFLGDLWTENDLHRWQEATWRLCRSFLDLGPGNPHQPGNNWWAVTHGGLHAATRALLRSGADPALTVAGFRLDQLSPWAWQRTAVFLGWFGPGGAYHEGLGYEAYTCSYFLPALLLRQKETGQRLTDRHPGLGEISAFFVTAGLRGPLWQEEEQNARPGSRLLSWNDAGLEWSGTATPWLALLLAPPAERVRLLPLLAQLEEGSDPPRSFSARMFLLLLRSVLPNLPSNTEAPVCPLPLTHFDEKHGLWITRDDFGDRNNTVLGAYAKQVHPGGHVHEDAGSFRYSSLGWDWILGGGQARPQAAWQSRLLPAEDPPGHPRGLGAVLWQTAEPPVFGMDLRKVQIGYHERYLALQPNPAMDRAPAVAVLDLVDDHRNDRDWIWAVTLLGCMKVEPIGETGGSPSGWSITAPDGTNLRIVFLGSPPDAFLRREVPGSRRTFSNGVVRDYAPRLCLQAVFRPCRPRNIYCVLHPQKAGEQLPLPCWETPGGSALRLPGSVWVAPFGGALPPGAVPGSLPGQCARPGLPPAP